MPEERRLLDQIEVAAPCPASWDAMTGDDRVRHCGECQLNVYNLSGMTANEAEKLVQETEGRLCVRYFRREDGTVLTEDCPVGLRTLRRSARWARARVAALAGLLTASLFGCTRKDARNPSTPAPGTTTPGHVEIKGEAITGICAPETIMGKMQMPEKKPPKPDAPKRVK